MDSVWRGALTYLFVWVVFRIAGKRSLAQITTFDAVLLLIISETTQAALTDNDNSITNSFLQILTLLGMDVVLSCLKQRFPRLEKIIEGTPLILLDADGLKKDAMTNERVDEVDILAAARLQRGIGTLNEIEFAVLEQSGGITIIPQIVGSNGRNRLIGSRRFVTRPRERGGLGRPCTAMGDARTA